MTDGSAGILSPDGRYLAFTRWLSLDGRPSRGSHDAEIAQTRIRDLVDGREWALPDEGGAGGYHHIPIAWGPRETLVRHDGSVVNTADGTAASGIALPPPDSEPVAESYAWTDDGRRLAYLAHRARPSIDPIRWEAVLFIIERGGTPTAVRIGDGAPEARSVWHSLRERVDGGRLAWTRDGERIYARLGFHVDGHWRRLSRVGALRPEGRMDVVATSTNDGEHDAHGWIGSGRTVLDAVHEHFVAFIDRGDWAPLVVVSTVDGSQVELVSDDASIKWSPAIEPSGRRVAFLAMPQRPASDTTGAPPTLRIVDRFSSAVIDLPFPHPGLTPNGLTWAPDGFRLVYELLGDVNGSGIYAQTVPPPGPRTGSPRPAPTRTSLVVKAFDSNRIDVVGWAVDRATESWEPDFGPAVESAVRRWEGRLVDASREVGDDTEDTIERLLRLADRMKLREAR